MLIAGIILGVILSFNIIGLIINNIYFKDELQSIQPYGQMIDVDGSRMHVYSMGNGEETIVLLPGYGVPLPSADFGPLMRKLRDKYTVVAVEYFGVGFSEEVETPRTNENYTMEIRTVLEKAGFKPPYILMPHSASGVYSEYYAAKYPEEISSIIMLDTTSTARIEKTPGYLKYIFSIAKFQKATGFIRLTSKLAPETKLIENGYTKKEREDYKKFISYTINNTMIDQSLRLMDNVKEVNTLPFPEDIPVLKIISKQSIDKIAKKDKNDGMKYQNDHLDRLGKNVSYEVLDATHFMYQSKVHEIVELTNQFLAKNKKGEKI
ncbi:MAG: alpha/beta hydrolase [Bacillota bacterium]|nr:alpha/beta hydrolase [Bacillota bacterium]